MFKYKLDSYVKVILNFENEKRNFGSRYMYMVLIDQKSLLNFYLEDCNIK